MAGTTGTLTIGAVSYTVYAFTADPLQDANDYLAASITAGTWATKTDDEKKALLISAFRTLDRQTWSGEADTDIAWPRTGATCNGAAVTDGEIPDDVVEAQFELASFLADSTDSVTSNNTDSNIKRVKAGSAEVEYFYPLSGEGTRFPLPVQELIGCYLAGSGAGLSTLLPYIGGGDANDSTFTSLDTDLNNGLA